jgi:hypothetical protein
LRVVDDEHPAIPKAKMPTVELPVADPEYDVAVEDVAEALISPEYVYLLRVAETETFVIPNANIPTVELPAAAPQEAHVLEDVAEELTSPE